MEKIKIDISVIGRFHAFNLAKSLLDKGMLNRLITTLPKLRVKDFGIENKKVKSFFICEIIVRIMRKTKLISKFPKLIYIYHHLYMFFLNKYASKSNSNIFIGFAGVSLKALKRAKANGQITILERGSSHRAYQTRILQEEYSLCDIHSNLDFNENEQVFKREMEEYKLVDYISIPSTFAKRTFIEHGIDENKLLVNPYGVDLKEFNPTPKNDDVFRVIFAGGGCLRKGYHYLLQAFSELDLPNSEFWHMGSVSEEVEPYLEKYKSNKIILKGHIPQNKLKDYYSQGSVFILPSIEDGFGMVIFQAMACGLPIICSENTGGPDLITEDGNEGFIVPIRDVESLKEKIVYLYNNPEICKNMGKNAQQKIINGYSWDDYGKRYIENIFSIWNSNVKK